MDDAAALPASSVAAWSMWSAATRAAPKASPARSKVIELVENADVWFNAHAWSSAVITAASLALSASTPRCLLFEMKPIPNPMQDELVSEPFRPVDGWITVPRAPGLGVDVDETVLQKYHFD